MNKKIIFLILSLLILPGLVFATNASISAVETVSNATLGLSDQEISFEATVNSATEVKASYSIFIDGLPDEPSSFTIGDCVISFTTTAGSTTDELDCSDNTASVDRDTGVGDVVRSATDIAGVIRTITNLSDTNHGTLSISGSSSRVNFTEAGTVTHAGNISFSDNTGGYLTVLSPTSAVVGSSQIDVATILGTVEVGDTFVYNLPTVGDVSYVVTSSDLTTSNIATGLNNAIQASSGYASQPFTSSVSDNVITITGKDIGGDYYQVSPSALNRQAAAQVVVFTPSNLNNVWDLEITINGTKYTRRHNGGDTTKTTVEALQALVDSNTAVNCTENDVSITCTASVAGTGFTYSTNVNRINTVSGSVSNFGCKDQKALNYNYFSQHDSSLCRYEISNINKIQKENLENDKNIKIFTNFLIKRGSNGDDVSLLQAILNNKIGTKLLIDGIFGLHTKEAVMIFQSKNGIKVDGIVGPQTKKLLVD